MPTYIFIEKKTYTIIVKKDFYGDNPASKAIGYAKALSNKTKVEVYTKVNEH